MMVEDFLLRALLAGLGVALLAGPLGCFIVWQRMAYFGATLAHGALLGVALGIALDVAPTAGIIVACVGIAGLLLLLQRQRRLPSDTLLGLLAHAALAIGLVVLSFLETVRVDLVSYLFGDVLAVRPTDLYWIYGGGALALAALIVVWRPLLAATVHEELAKAEGLNVTWARTVFILTIALTIAVAMKIVGILLIVSLLIIPAAAARRFARTPEQMAVIAAVVACLSVVAGLAASYIWDTPAGPSMVVAATCLFVLAHGMPMGQAPS